MQKSQQKKDKRKQAPGRNARGQYLPGVSGHPEGRPLGRKNFASAIMDYLESGKGPSLEEIIEKMFKELMDSNNPATLFNALADRLDGKPPTQVQILGDADNFVDMLRSGEERMKAAREESEKNGW